MERMIDRQQRYEPAPERVVLRKLMEDRTPGGLIIPEGALPDQTFGQVVAVGSAVTFCKPKDIVQVPNNLRAYPLTLNGEKLFVLESWKDLLGVLHMEDVPPRDADERGGEKVH